MIMCGELKYESFGKLSQQERQKEINLSNLLYCEGMYATGISIARGNRGRVDLHVHKSKSPVAALRFCTKEAAEQTAKAINAAGGEVWNAVQERVDD